MFISICVQFYTPKPQQQQREVKEGSKNNLCVLRRENKIILETLTAVFQGSVILNLSPGLCWCGDPPGHHHHQTRPTRCSRTSALHLHPEGQGSSSAPCSRHWCRFLEGKQEKKTKVRQPKRALSKVKYFTEKKKR